MRSRLRILGLLCLGVLVMRGDLTAQERKTADSVGELKTIGIIDETVRNQSMELRFVARIDGLHGVDLPSEIRLEYDGDKVPMKREGNLFKAILPAHRLENSQRYVMTVEMPNGSLFSQGWLNVDMPELKIEYDEAIDRAAQLAMSDLEQSKMVKCGCLTIPPQVGGHYNGVWLTDSGESYEAIRYWADNDYMRDYLYKTAPGQQGLIDFFAELQEADGPFKGNICEVKYEDGHLDQGGSFDLSQNPRTNHRDLGNSVFVFCNYWYWKDTGETRYIERYYPVMKAFLAYHLGRRDAETGLLRNAYGIDHSDVCIDFSVARSCALFASNSLVCTALNQFSEMAAGLGRDDDAQYYREQAQALKAAINRTMWNEENGRYEIKIFENVTTNKDSPAYGMTEDHHFFPASHGRFLEDWGDPGWMIPDTPDKTRRIIEGIERVQTGLKVDAAMISQAYPDGWHNAIFNGGAYHNGDCWPEFGCRYLVALFNLGRPERALRGLHNLAEAGNRDGSFNEHYQDDAEGAATGVPHYNWTNALFLYTVVKGLYGLQADYPNGRMIVHPSLEHSAKIRCRLGRHGVEMDWRVQAGEPTQVLTLTTTYSGQGDFRIWLGKDVLEPVSVRRDGKPVECELRAMNGAAYVAFVAAIEPGENVYEIATGQ